MPSRIVDYSGNDIFLVSAPTSTISQLRSKVKINCLIKSRLNVLRSIFEIHQLLYGDIKYKIYARVTKYLYKKIIITYQKVIFCLKFHL